MATANTKMKTLSSWAWVSSAVDSTSYTTALTGVYSDGSTIAATNRHILFIAKDNQPQGLRHPKTLASIDAEFPNYQQIVPKQNDTHTIDTQELLAMCRASIAYSKSQSRKPGENPIRLGSQAFNPAYLELALRGSLSTNGSITQQDGVQPLRIDMGDDRVAVIMPVKVDLQTCKFDASHALQAHPVEDN